MFVLLLKYLKPLEEVDAHLPAHREFLDRCYREGKLICSGPREPRTGGVILADVDSELEAMKIVVEDPFFTHKVAEYELVRFTPNRYDPRFAAFVDSSAG
ncbi:MAG TPA: YciI family protein [Longimicrobiaceae bacterium]|nr:YciI family protein [Longimicrobiaceae bacterium]